MRRQDDLMTTSTNGLSFCGVHQGGPQAGAPHCLVDPEATNLTATTPRVAANGGHDLTGCIFD
jgi:hypothetical protein